MNAATQRELAEAFGLAGPSPAPTFRGLAKLVRELVARCAPMRRSELTQRVKTLCQAAGFESSRSEERLKEVLTQLEGMGDIVPVRTGVTLTAAAETPERDQELEEASVPLPTPESGELRLLPGLLTLVRFEHAVLVTGSWIGEQAHYDLQSSDDCLGSVARWCSIPGAERILGTLELCPTDWVHPKEWLADYPVKRLLSARRIGKEEPQGKLIDLRMQLWSEILSELRAERATTDDVRLIVKSPGGYFGKHKQLSGRWKSWQSAPDGLWLGVRAQQQGSNQERTSPVLVSIESGKLARSADLRSWEEFRWALLLKGEAEQQPEQLIVKGEYIHQTCPLPSPLQELLRLLPRQDSESGCWQFKRQAHVADSLLRFMKELGGLVIT